MKIKYEIVDLTVSQMMNVPCNNDKDVDLQCKKIADFITACGWDEDEFHNYQQPFTKSN